MATTDFQFRVIVFDLQTILGIRSYPSLSLIESGNSEHTIRKWLPIIIKNCLDTPYSEEYSGKMWQCQVLGYIEWTNRVARLLVDFKIYQI